MRRLLDFISSGFVLLGVAVWFGAPFGHGQVADDPVNVPVHFQGMFNAIETGDPELPPHVNIVALGVNGVSSPSYGEAEAGNEILASGGFARLRPGRTYLFEIQTYAASRVQVKVTPPAGHRVYINGVEHEMFDWAMGGGGALDPQGFFSVRLDDGSGGIVGEVESLRPGRILWSIGLGNLRNGKPAGSIRLAEDGITANTFKPAALFYDHDSKNQNGRYVGDDGEVVVVKVGNVLRQVYAAAVLADIAAINDRAFSVKLYPRTQVSDPGSGLPFTVSGTPLYEFVVENPHHPALDALRITRTVTQGGATVTSWTQMSKSTPVAGTTQWLIDDWVEKPLGATAVSSPVRQRWTYSDSDRNEHFEVLGADGLVVQSAFKRYIDLNFGVETTRELHFETAGYGGSAPVTTTYTYHQNFWEPGSWHKVRSITSTDGSWTAFDYYDDFRTRGQVRQMRRPNKNAPASDPGLNSMQGEVTSFTYGFQDGFGTNRLPTRIETVTDYYVTARSDMSYAYEFITDSSVGYSTAANAVMPVTVTTKRDYFNSSQYLTSVSRAYSEDADPEFRFFTGLPYSAERPDRTMTAHVYYRSAFQSLNPFGATTAGTSRVHATLQGTSDPTMGVAMTLYEVTSQPLPANFRVVAGKSAESRTLLSITSLPGVVEQRSYLGTWEPVRQDWTTYVDAIWPAIVQRRTAASGPFWEVSNNTWMGGRLMAEVDEAGARQSFIYDSVGRVSTMKRDQATGAGTTIAAHITSQTFDAAGRLRTRSTSGAGETLTSTINYDTAGRVTDETAPGLGTKYYVYNVGSRMTTLTLPSTYTQIETRFLDGRPSSVTGTGVVAKYFDYESQPDGRRKSTVWLRSPYDPRRQEEWSDWLGRPSERRAPGFNGSTAFVETMSYDPARGQLKVLSRTGYADTRYEYSGMGELVRSGLDLNGGGLQPVSTDRITDSDQSVESYAGAYWMTKQTWAFHQHNQDIKKLISVTRQRLTGLSATLRAETRTRDAEDNESNETVTVDAAAKLVTTTSTNPGMANAATQVMLNGKAVASTGHDGLTYRQTYDALGRLQAVIDPRTGTAASNSISYMANTTLPAQRRDASNRIIASLLYDGAGRVIFTQDADGRTIRTGYHRFGPVEYSWGSGTYPVSYVYDDYGQRTHQRTYRDPANSVPNFWEVASWPGAAVASQNTEWEYDAYTGLLKKKYDPNRQYVEYTYNERGQTAQRFWARVNNGQRVSSTYTYFSGTGDLQSVVYNDTTPSVSYQASSGESFTRLGQTRFVTDVSGMHSFNYDDASNPGRLTSETLPASFYGVGGIPRSLVALFDGTTSTNTGTADFSGHTINAVKGRSGGFRLGVNPTASSYEIEQTFGGSAVGRFAGIVAKRTSGAGVRTFVYGYELTPGGQASTLVKTLSAVGHAFHVTRSFEANRDVLASIDTRWSGMSRTRFDYVYDNVRRRESSVQTGDAFADIGATHQRFSYNTRGEITSARSYAGIDAASTASPLSARLHDYEYDAIGNRKSSNSSGDPALRDDYTVNDKNQYSARENNTLAVQGTAHALARVAVSGPTPTPSGGQGLAGRPAGSPYWGHNLVVDNLTRPFAGNVTAYSVLSGAGAGGTDLFRTESKAAFLPRVAQNFTYDEDGNLKTDGLWTYSWDAENRLIRMEATDEAANSGRPNLTLEFRYDYQNRRVKKEVRNRPSGTLISERRFIYDGWNVIAEIDGSGTLKRSFAWGLDLHGSLTASGGVGALLQVHDFEQNKTLLPAFDGNGNVVALFNAESPSGTLEASYEYSPFGELQRTVGSYALANPFRFSSKWQDDESELVYYGFRYYSAREGRFLGRDPIEEEGGLNLYGFCGNDGANRYDYLGQKSFLSKFWSKFRHTIISAVISVIPVYGPALALMYNTAVGARYGGVKGAVMALASGGKLGGYAQLAASYYGLYQQFSQGKFLNNLGNFLAGRLVANTAYQFADAVINGGAKPIVKMEAEKESMVDASSKEWVDPECEGRGRAQFYLRQFNEVTRQWDTYLTDRIDTKYVYVNGIIGSLADHISLAQEHLDRRFSGIKQYTLMNNPSHGGGSDILETGLDILGFSSHPARVFAAKLGDALARGLKPTVIGHSQGGAILTQSLRILQAKGVDATGLTVMYHAAASNSQYARAVSRSIGATFGGHAYSPHDIVASVVGMNASVTQVIPAILSVRDLFGSRTESQHSVPNGAAKYPWSVYYPGGP